MPEYKNQHYVPQHYLKGWAEDKKSASTTSRTDQSLSKLLLARSAPKTICTATRLTSKKNSKTSKNYIRDR